MKIRSAVAASIIATGFASANTIRFVPNGSNGSQSGISTSATLTSDASSLTITFKNSSSSGLVTGFFMETGSALAGLGQTTIVNGDGVRFSQLGGELPSRFGVTGLVNGTTLGASALGQQNPIDTGSNPGSGFAGSLQGWAGTHFAMIREGSLQNGQATGESLSVTFSHDGTFSLQAFIDALRNDEIRLVQRYHTGGVADASGLLVGTLTVVPLPAAAWAGLGLLGAVAGARALKRRG